MSYPADPGGIFASDAHRRVQAALPNPNDEPLSAEDVLSQRVALDDHLDIGSDELEEVLSDLEADGHAENTKDGWKNTSAGFDALTGPIAEDVK